MTTLPRPGGELVMGAEPGWMGLWCRIDCRSATPPGKPELESAGQTAAYPNTTASEIINIHAMEHGGGSGAGFQPRFGTRPSVLE